MDKVESIGDFVGRSIQKHYTAPLVAALEQALFDCAEVAGCDLQGTTVEQIAEALAPYQGEDL